ncbi:hypothetical protein ACF0H5_007251 [Mactra antiquata]
MNIRYYSVSSRLFRSSGTVYINHHILSLLKHTHTNMQFFKYFAITVVILALVIPADAGWFRRAVRKVKKVVKKVGKAVKKVGCKILFGVACPAAVAGAGTVIGAGTSGMGSALVATGVALGTNACNVRKEKCKRKRSADEVDEVLLSFSDQMSDYDFNGDKLIAYEEFVWAVIRTVPLADPQQLEEPFMFADFDGNGVLDTDEFKGAPFMFAHVSSSDSAIAA